MRPRFSFQDIKAMSRKQDRPQPEKDDFMAIAGMGVPARLRAKFDIADVVQDALLSVHRNAGALKGRSIQERKAYLKKALASALADRIRHFQSRRCRASRECSLEAVLDDGSGRLERWLAVDQTSPSQRASRNEQLVRLAAAIASLPDDQRQAVQLHHLEKRSLAATAAIMDRSKQSVAGLIRRGIKALRDRLEERDRTGS
jgi:RNA polymerase sigma-70 factor (ECF subfamily)